MQRDKLLSKMKKLLIPYSRHCSFWQLTTLRCGGKISLAIFPKTQRQIVLATRYLVKNKIPFCVVGCGSNLLASDDYYDGVVICTKNLTKTRTFGKNIYAFCGAKGAKIAQICIKKGLSGGEFLACLPATIGGAVACNAGCFGQSAQDIVKQVVCLQGGKIVKFSLKKCKFFHRNSIFKGGERVILGVKLKFAKSTSQQVEDKIRQMKGQKAQTQPLGEKSAGCVLYHPQVAISRLVDQAGLKGYRIGDAQISKKHAGFVINIDKATSQDIYLLISHIKRVLKENYDVTPQTELCLVNFKGANDDIFSNDQAGNSQKS